MTVPVTPVHRAASARRFAMNASDIMVADVVTVTPDETVRDVANILLTRRISGVPVVDKAGRLVGLVSESDLLRRAEAGTEHQKLSWLRLLLDRESLVATYVKEHARKVADVMTRRVITAAPDTPVAEIAAKLERNRIKRVPIVDNGKVVGIVCRSDVLKLVAGAEPQSAAVTTDDSLREKILATMNAEGWSSTSQISVFVRDARVELTGFVEYPIEKTALRVLAENTPGVQAVNDHIGLRRTIAAGV
jgi:CBS domain-containing protein